MSRSKSEIITMCLLICVTITALAYTARRISSIWTTAVPVAGHPAEVATTPATTPEPETDHGPSNTPGPRSAERLMLLREAFERDDEGAVSRLARVMEGGELNAALAILKENRATWKTLRAFLSTWAAKDPQAALEWAISNLPRGGDRSFVVNSAMTQWVKSNPTAALDRALAMSTKQGRSDALTAIFLTWADIDPQRAAQGLDARGDFPGRDKAIGITAYSWAARDRSAATAWACNLQDDNNRIRAVAAIAAQIYDTDRNHGDAWLRSLPDNCTDNDAMRKISPYLLSEGSGGTTNPPPEPETLPPLQVYLANWAISDSDAAVAWASQLTNDQARGAALMTIAQAVAPSDPAAATRIQAIIPASSPSLLPQETTSRDTVSAEQLPDGAKRDALIHSLAVQMAKDDPGGALEWVIGQMSPGLELDATVRTIIWDWAERDSAAAIAWISQLTDSSAQTRDTATVAMSLARTNPSAAAQVADTLPVGTTKSNVVVNVAYNWAIIDPIAATAWVQTLSEDDGAAAALAAISKASGQ